MAVNQQLTTMKVDKDIFEAFKIECVKSKFSLQKLAERGMHMYLTNEEFKKSIHNHMDLNLKK